VWATTWFGGDLYAFGLDQQAIAATLREEMAAIGGQGSALAVGLFTAGERVPADVLEEKPLSPWLTGWTLAVWARDPRALRAAERRQGLLRNAAITIAVGMIGVGAFLILRLVKRELDVARMKTDFAASVSHELRSPITQIRLKGESLMLGLSESEEERQEAYQAIVRESERLSRLVDNVLDFAAIERGAKRYTLRPDDLTETVYKAVDSISSAQEVADKELDVDLPPELPTVYHDPDAVAQCVINLVSNAAKYSSPGGWIGIRAAVVEDGVELSIEDRGIGIAAHDLPHLFEPFFRSRDSLARRRKGTGIGLTITRYIMRAHGGDIRVQSQPGQGSTFYLHFPLQPPAGADIGGPVGR
jgi:signal transduction histidine kinase